MAITIAVTRGSANLSTGNQDFTTPAFGGGTPNAALFMVTRAVSDGTAANHALLGFGAATATTERWAVACVSESGLADTDVHRRAMTDQCVYIPDLATGTDGEADFVAFITNGVRVNWGDAPASAYLVTVILFGVEDAYAGVFSAGTSVGSAVDVTAPGFEPGVVLFSSHGDAFNDTTGLFFTLSFGFAVNDGSNTQRFIGFYEQAATAAGDPNAWLDTTRAVAQLNVGVGTPLWASEIGSFDSQGFSATLRQASAGSDQVGYLALKLPTGAQVWVGTHSTPTATGNQSSTAPGFRPQVVILGMTQVTATDTAVATAAAGAFGVGVFTDTAAFSNTITIENASATTNTQSVSDDQPVNLPTDAGATGITATFVSLDSSGWTLNFGATLGSARKWIALALADAGQPARRRLGMFPHIMPGQSKELKIF